MKSSYVPVAVFIASLVAVPVFGQFIEAPTPPPPSLKELSLPTVVDRVSGLPLVDDGGGGFIKNEQAAILLGKSLFWDTQAGSRRVACGTCHYHAGRDNRTRNQLHQGGDGLFGMTNTGGGGPNYDLNAADFPTHNLANPTDRDSAVLNDLDDVVSSQGTFAADFNDIVVGSATDDCDIDDPDPFGFHVNGTNVRRVEPRNTPTVINAVFNHRNFWDGRANNIFNGVDHNGLRNTDAKILTNKEDNLLEESVEFENSSLASQAVAPMVSTREMSCNGRTFPKIGKKMLSLEALADQRVHPSDSVLGGLSNDPKKGLDGPGNNGIPYTDLVEAAFSDWLWDSDALFDIDRNQVGSGTPSNTDQYTQAEINFSLIWGLAIMAYERTLVSDNAPFDQWSEADSAAGRQDMPVINGHGILSADEIAGMNLFFENEIGARGLCSTCHQGPVFSTATFPFTEEEESGEFPEQEQLVERMKMGDGVTIAEDLLQFFIAGEGSGAGYNLSGTAGSRLLPNRYPATVGGDFSVNGCQRRVHSYLMDQDLPIPSFVGPPTRDAVFVVQGTEPGGCGEEWLQITLIDNGPGADFVTVQQINPIVRTPVPQMNVPIPTFIGPPISGPIDGDFTLNGPTLYDTAFYNIGVRPTGEDLGVGADDAFGNPLSFTKQWINSLLGTPTADDMPFELAHLHLPFSYDGDAVFFPGGLAGAEWPIVAFFPCDPPITGAPPAGGFGACTIGVEEGLGQEAFPRPPSQLGYPITSFGMFQHDAIENMATAVDGSFKTAGLRNVELTGPYFHNGGQMTLDQVVDFYNRGGDFAIENLGSLSPNIHPLGLDETQRGQIVAFLKALTDNAVRCEQAPFDHPEIRIADGAKKQGPSEVKEDPDNKGQSQDNLDLIPAVGAGGRLASGLPCLEGFLE